MEQLCWDCKKSVGGCSWADELKPVKGWTAEKTIVHETGVKDFESYSITACPEFVPNDRRIITTEEIAKILGCCESTVLENKLRSIDQMKEKGYTIKFNYQDKLWYELRRC